ncbi:ribose ABC transporter substrate-binding protein RbsB [Shimazuella sp. AN120528]|uniref:ribose ABC transporter substrate-binding protein RbsB n=1 Tax=Shimazuella soli TaxID=1892854 RepID=UPI001F0D3A33|nr:ribose ABC transporter substrate-binding protein RbsB [Shimazuella soli]MCH5584302.1 ribose ABC transporter substrate-binding protein RbsB [Shimazuella soli]
MKKIFTLVLVGMLLLVGCSMQPAGQEKTSDKKSAKTIGLSISTMNNPFFVTLKNATEKKAKELGYTLITVDAQNNSAKQASDVEDLIQKNVDFLLINPVDSDAVVSAVQSANNANIPVITLDRSANGGKVVSHIASDNVSGGEMAGKHLLQLVGNGANIVELEGVPGSSAARERGQGFHKVIDGKLKVVSKQSADFDRSKGLSVMENIIQGNKNIQGVFAQNDEMALGALEALKSAGLTNVKVIGFDGTDEAKAAVNKGELSATIAQKPDVMGETAIETVKKVLAGEKVDANIPVPLELVVKK